MTAALLIDADSTAVKTTRTESAGVDQFDGCHLTVNVSLCGSCPAANVPLVSFEKCLNTLEMC